MLPELIETPDNNLPEAQIVFDGELADKWLHDSGERRRNVFHSVRFEPDEMPKDQVIFLLELVTHSIVKEAFTRKGVSLGRGVLYVPLSLAKSEVLAGMERGKRVGKYTEFFVK